MTRNEFIAQIALLAEKEISITALSKRRVFKINGNTAVFVYSKKDYPEQYLGYIRKDNDITTINNYKNGLQLLLTLIQK